jgi:hypothetical protein
MTGLSSLHVLHPAWYKEIKVSGIDPSQPGLYEWRIEGVGVYIGQYTHATRPRREYGLNVRRLVAKRPHRKNKPHGFQNIHRILEQAVRASWNRQSATGRIITLALIENQRDKLERNRRERQLIAQCRAEAERDGLEFKLRHYPR